MKIISTEVYDTCSDYTVTVERTDINQPIVHISKVINFNKALYTQLLEVMAILLEDLKDEGCRVVHTIVPNESFVKFATRFGFMPKSILSNVDTGERFILMSQEVG